MKIIIGKCHWFSEWFGNNQPKTIDQVQMVKSIWPFTVGSLEGWKIENLLDSNLTTLSLAML